jgi:hypothetical protein
MLLSLPTWLIHLFSVTEWFVAMLLFRRYGRLMQRWEPQLFASCMTPHLLAGLSILLFHLGGDTQRLLLEMARMLTFCGSLLLCASTLAMVLACKGHSRGLALLIVPLALAWALYLVLTNPEPSAAILHAANLLYLLFLVNLLWLHRLDRTLFSRLTIGGFWFLLVFVAVAIVNTWIATSRHGLPSLSHDDLLHGLSESLLSVSNLMVALGAYAQIKQSRIRLASIEQHSIIDP